MKDKDDDRLSNLFESAHKDRHLKLRLLADPQKVAEEWGVKLGDRETQRLTKLGERLQERDPVRGPQLHELATELREGSIWRCDPRVCYPVATWLRSETVRLVRDLVKYHVFYPPRHLHRLDERISQNLGLPRRREI